MKNPWTKEELDKHIKVNTWGDSYSAAVVVAALYHVVFGEFPKLGLSGFQGEAAKEVFRQIENLKPKGEALY